MSQVINTNVASLNSQRQLSNSQNSLATSLQRLSSGLRINSAKDDAAGLAISDRFTSQIRGLDQARRNANDGISLAQTGDANLESASNILQRIRELAVQSTNGTNTGSDRQALNLEAGQLLSELQRISNAAEFNGKKLFDGSFGSQAFQVGANAYQTISVSSSNLQTNQYGLNTVTGTIGVAATGSAADVASTGAATLTLNGINSASVSAAGTDNAKELADKINAVSGDTGVTAQARTVARLSFSATGAYGLSLRGDNSTAVNVTFNVSATSTADGLSQAISEINKQSASTGIAASLDESGTYIRLESSSGTDMVVGNTSGAGNVTLTTEAVNSAGVNSTGASISVASGAAAGNFASVRGTVTLDSSSGFNISAGAASMFANGATSSGSSSSTVSLVDLTSVSKATFAIRIADKALSTISTQRAQFGAIQSRFETTISNLQASSENLSASRSRILDADFAAETANLTRAQILQQAGTAMLAQANALPQNVLTLLRG
ncbi:MAG TPA: flagellin [Azonexus sp.]|nr:flagellin [Azonexus sp.]